MFFNPVKVDAVWAQQSGPSGRDGRDGRDAVIPKIEIPKDGTDGRSLTPKGKWKPKAEYNVGDIVNYRDDSYIATMKSQNEKPSERSKFWMTLAKSIRGKDGKDGIGQRGSRGLPGESGTTETQTIEMIFDSAALAGQPVYASSDGHVDLAMADERYRVIGLAKENVAAGAVDEIITDGILTLADWSAVIHESSLFVGSTYFLSHTSPGFTTKVAPDSTGFYVQPVFRCLNLTTVEVEIGRPIKP